MSQAVVTILGLLGVLVLTLLMGTGFGADLDFSLRRNRPAAGSGSGASVDKLAAERGVDATTQRCERP